MQVLDQQMSKLGIEETFEESSRSLIVIPKNVRMNYPFGFWIPMKSEQYPKNKPSDNPILPMNSLLGMFVMLGKSKECGNCGKTLLPKPSNMMKLPEKCPDCGFNGKVRSIEVKNNDIKRSSTFERLNRLLDEAFKKYYEHADFRQKDDYTENYYHKKNHEIYLNETIIQDASEIVSCIDSIISFDGIPSKYFNRDGITYKHMFKEIIENLGILKLKPHYDLLTLASSIIKSKQLTIRPLVRGSRLSPANVTNVPNQLQSR